MPSTNGHGLKTAVLWAIIYARVSTDEQARSGYSLAQQIEACRAWCEREGYEALEIIADPGQSGASLERPGMDRVRDLVAAGGVSVVLAQDRDRFAREPAYLYLLRKELEEHECMLRALNDRGDDTPEGELTDGILDQLAKFERAKIAERTRRGRLRRAEEGKIVGNNVPNYGFLFNDARDNYLVNPDAMAVVRRIFYAVGVDGEGLAGVKKALDGAHVPTPGGARFWSRIFLRRLILDDVYKPHTFEEVAEIVSPQVAARLDPGERYGVWWYGRNRVIKQQVAESLADGTRYRRKSKSVPKPKTEWIGVPVPDSGIPREWVDAAREAIKDNRRTSNSGARFWELSGGIARCGVCNSRMQATSVSTHAAHPGYYYRCAKRWQDGKDACPNKKTLNARKAEPLVWEAVSVLLKDPVRLRQGLASLVEEERKSLKTDPSREAKVWAQKIAESDRKRSKFQEMAAEGLITLDELRAKLCYLEETREVAERELEMLRRRADRIAGLQCDADSIMDYYAGMVPEGLENLTPQERYHVYRMLRLEVLSYPDGSLKMSGLVRQERELCGGETSSRRRYSSSR